MRWWVSVAAVLAAVVALSAPRGVDAQPAQESDCMDLPLGPVPEWDMVVLGDANWNAGENEGRAVVGRDATFASFGVGTRLPLDRKRLDLAVGRELHFDNSGLNNGHATYGTESQRPAGRDLLREGGTAVRRRRAV